MGERMTRSPSHKASSWKARFSIQNFRATADGGRQTRSSSTGRLKAKDDVYDPEIGTDDTKQRTCCFAWRLSKATQCSIKEAQLKLLHEQMLSLAALAGARFCEVNAMGGTLRCLGSLKPGSPVTACDTAVRLGQMLCQWAASQDSELCIQIGIHIGTMTCMPLSGRYGYFGSAIAVAVQLAEDAPTKTCMHLSQLARASLGVFELLPFRVKSWGTHQTTLRRQSVLTGHSSAANSFVTEDTYFLDPVLEGLDPAEMKKLFDEGTKERVKRSSVNIKGVKVDRMLSTDSDSSVFKVARTKTDKSMDRFGSSDGADSHQVISTMQSRGQSDLTLKDLNELLGRYDVDTSKFGTGQAISLDEFHKELLQEKKSYLVIKNNEIERRMELARLDLSVEDSEGKERTLYLAMEIQDDGRALKRNQKLAVKVKEGATWEDAVRDKLEDCFGLTAEEQHTCIEIKGNSYKKETVWSPHVPGMKTVYMTHEVKMQVKDPTNPSMSKIGLPSMALFMTDSAHGGNRSSETATNSRSMKKQKPKKSQWMWRATGQTISNVESLQSLLQDHNINVTEFSQDALNDLVTEVYESKTSTLKVSLTEELLRHLEIVKVWIATEILSVPHFLVTKAKVQHGKLVETDPTKDRAITMRMHPGQNVLEAAVALLEQRLGLYKKFQAEHVFIDPSSHRVSEEIEYSRSYPGLKTVYRIHDILCRVLKADTCIGLPEGVDFMFSRTSSGAADPVVTSFSWRTAEEIFGGDREAQKNRALVKRASYRSLCNTPGSLPGGGLEMLKDPDPKRVLAAPPPLVPIVPEVSVFMSTSSSTASDKPSYLIQELMHGRSTDWVRARRAARKIREKGYSCKEFYEDCSAAFPELLLYVAQKSPHERTAMDLLTTSGRSGEDEYRRTVGALFAVYWLVRLDIDGDRGFTFGLNDDWQPWDNTKDVRPVRDPDEVRKRILFWQQVDWKLFQIVVTTAGLTLPGNEDMPAATSALTQCGNALSDSKAPRAITGFDEERVLAMLVLTAIHDVMKVEALLPTVDAKVGKFGGHIPGEVVRDHDMALAYILEHVPDALPSFRGLEKKSQDVVKFTQCNMEYNMGWLVQAEAPPGALFRKFKSIICNGSTNQSDVAFYFVHWLTDLAGAEPFPQEGCEKFVLKFPMKVLTAFLGSFSFAERLVDRTETEVFEEYLSWRWNAVNPELGPLSKGPGCLARQRLVVMAQGHERDVLKAYDSLPSQVKNCLAKELAYTGIDGQAYEIDVVDSEEGPAFLVYYAPALLQRNSAQNATGALKALAEVLWQARSLWPLDTKRANDTVTLRIDAIKDLDVHELQELPPGEFWALLRTSNKDGQVKRTSLQAQAMEQPPPPTDSKATIDVDDMDDFDQAKANRQRILNFASPCQGELRRQSSGRGARDLGTFFGAAHSLTPRFTLAAAVGSTGSTITRTIGLLSDGQDSSFKDKEDPETSECEASDLVKEVDDNFTRCITCCSARTEQANNSPITVEVSHRPASNKENG